MLINKHAWRLTCVVPYCVCMCIYRRPAGSHGQAEQLPDSSSSTKTPATTRPGNKHQNSRTGQVNTTLKKTQLIVAWMYVFEADSWFWWHDDLKLTHHALIDWRYGYYYGMWFWNFYSATEHDEDQIKLLQYLVNLYVKLKVNLQ